MEFFNFICGGKKRALKHEVENEFFHRLCIRSVHRRWNRNVRMLINGGIRAGREIVAIAVTWYSDCMHVKRGNRISPRKYQIKIELWPACFSTRSFYNDCYRKKPVSMGNTFCRKLLRFPHEGNEANFNKVTRIKLENLISIKNVLSTAFGIIQVDDGLTAASLLN